MISRDQVLVLENPMRDGVRWHLGEVSNELGVATALAGEKVGDVL